jgi:hypothetical protein
MKKKLLILGVLFVSVGSFAQYYSAFDTLQFYNFSPIDADGDGNDWGVYDLTGSGFTNLEQQVGTLGSRSWDTAPLTPDNWIFSEVIDLTGVSGTVALNWKAGSPETTASTWFEEYYSVYVFDGLTNFNPAATPVYSGTLPGGENMFFSSFNISSMAGVDSLIIAFRHHNCTDENFLFIDDINVTNTLGLGELVNDDLVLTVYPNPTVDVLNFEAASEMSTISVISLDGKVLIHEDRLNNNKYSLNVSELSPGVYVYEVIDQVGKITRNSFVKK